MSKKDIKDSEETINDTEEIEEEVQNTAEESEEQEKTEEDSEEKVEAEDSSKIEIEELTTRLMRLQADFDNYRKRVEKEKTAIVQYASSGLVEKILPVLDNFDRALAEEIKSENKNEGFFDGVNMIRNQMIEALKSEGVEEIEAVGKPFDHNFHNAIQQVDSDEYESGIVTEEYQKGYMLKDRVIRPSMVVVAK